MLPTKFRVNWPFGSGEEVKNRVQDEGYGSHLGFPIGTILAIFEKRKIDFQDGRHGARKVSK